MKNRFLLVVILISLVACRQEQKFPDILFERIPPEKVILKNNIMDTARVAADSVQTTFPECLNRLTEFARFYNEKNEKFSLEKMKMEWENCNTEITLNRAAAVQWAENTCLLFQLTGEEKYAEELEHFFYVRLNQHLVDKQLSDVIASCIFTKNVDHIHANLYIPAEINYEHTLHGHVKIEMETNFPKTGRIELKFTMGENRYIELFVRIPSWAEDATVTVSGVKYVAKPGSYSQIAKKWKSGDVAEIYFSMNQAPSYLKINRN